MPVVAFVNMKGGVAKTTLAVNVAHALATREGYRVLLIDLDPQFNATQCLVSGKEYIRLRAEEGVPTVLDIFKDEAATTVSPLGGEVTQAPIELKDIRPYETPQGIDLVLGDLQLYRLEVAAGQGRERRLQRYLEEIDASNQYDYVLIDTPPTPSVWMMSGLLAAEYYAVPVKAEPLSTVGIDLLRNIVDRFSKNQGIQLTCAGVVLTVAEANTIAFRETKEFLDKNPIWKDERYRSHLPKRTAIARGQRNQQLILELDDVDARRMLTNIVTEFIERTQDV